MIREELVEILGKTWPMLFIFAIVISSIRIVYVKVNREKFVLYKELLTLLFMLYILVLFYIVTYQDPISNSISSYNFIPFKEMLRYRIGTNLFYKNIIGNLVIFVPFGLFIPYYLKTSRFSIVLGLSLISSLAIEFAQQLIIGRVFDVDDIILNVVGSLIGYILYVIIDAIMGKLPKFFKKDWFINSIIIILIVFIILYLGNIDLKSIKVLP